MFEVTIKLTYEEFRKYIYAVIAAKRSSETKAFRRERVIMLSLTFTALAVFTGFLIYTYAETGDRLFLGALIAAGAVAIYGVYRVINFAVMYKTPGDAEYIRRMWEKAVKANGEEYRLIFGEDAFDLVSDGESVSLRYSIITRLIETQAYFYIIADPEKVLIVNKADCTKEQCMFIRTHCSSEERPQITVTL
ncbi:MAG: YcxB family protein [Ruminiclostridium sp.]|nr:YcxB family protein [Ruminiclostridium sp.]